MARPTDASAFLDKIRLSGGRISNRALQQQLGWKDEKYWKIHQQQFDAGMIEKGKGQGGTVILISKSNPTAAADVAAVDLNDVSSNLSNASPDKSTSDDGVIGEDIREYDLYKPVLQQIQTHWAQRRQLDSCHCEITAQQGRRDTGGSWSRPDLTAVGYKKYEYLPDKTLEVFTFEVKASYDVSIKGVLEALAHREAATRSYVVYHTAGRSLDEFPEAVRIEELAVRHGIGVLVARDVNDFTSWDEIAVATRNSPDPDNLETFIKRTLTDDAKSQLRKWL